MYNQAILFAKLKSIGEGEDRRLTLDIPYPIERLGELGLDFAVNDKSYHSEGGGSVAYDASLDGVDVVARITYPVEFDSVIKGLAGYQGDEIGVYPEYFNVVDEEGNAKRFCD